MSNNLRWFFRLAFFVPFFFMAIIFFRGYAVYQFGQSLETCYSGQWKASSETQQAEMRQFISCLQENNNLLVRWYIKPERYYEAIQPHTPCQWIGRWQAKREQIAFAIELKANGKFKVDAESMSLLHSQQRNDYSEGYEGVWSSPNKNTILWFAYGQIWPIDQNKVEWLNADQLVIHELKSEKTYYQRQSAHIENCPYYP
jgi:hypothetical protein